MIPVQRMKQQMDPIEHVLQSNARDGSSAGQTRMTPDKSLVRLGVGLFLVKQGPWPYDF